MDSQLIALKKAVTNYVMPEKAKQLLSQSHILLLCGVTAAGKETIANYLIDHGGFDHVVSHTTRAPRQNHGTLEQNGKEYWFVDVERMLKMLQDKAFVEAKQIHGDTVSGTSIEALETVVKTGKHPINVIDVQGALELTRAVPSIRPVFILPPSFDIWMERLGTRGFMSYGEKQRRLASARMELSTAIRNPQFLFVINNEMEQTALEIRTGVDTNPSIQSERRKLAEELLEYVKR